MTSSGGWKKGYGQFFDISVFVIFFLKYLQSLLKSVQRFKSWYFLGPSSGQTIVFTGWPSPKLGQYEVSLKPLKPFLRVLKLLNCGQNWLMGPCRDVFTKVTIVWHLKGAFHFVQEKIEKANFSDKNRQKML